MSTATEIIGSWPEAPGQPREALILEALSSGRHPPIQWAELSVQRGQDQVTLMVATDAVKVGDALDAVRINATAKTAQQIADLFQCVLPTTRICDLIWEQAAVQLSPSFQTPDALMANTSRMVSHSRSVDAKLGVLSGLVANVGKDWVLSNKLFSNPGRAANYGWYDTHAPNHRMWQTLGLRHGLDHVDYSQVVRLVQRRVRFNNVSLPIDDPSVAWALSSEGPLQEWRIPGVPASSLTNGGPPVAPPAPVARALRRGHRGPDVMAWQTSLETVGYSLLPFGADGDFGRTTERRTLDFQLAQGLVPDGVVGPITRRAMQAVLSADEGPPSTTVASLGQRCVDWCREAMASENPPSAHTIALWFSHAERNGVKLGITRGNHCAIAQSMAALQSAAPGDRVPHRPRAAAKELRDDARAQGAWHERAEVLNGTFAPRVGDLAVYDRSQPGRPETAWWGHVDRVSRVFADSFENIGANEGPGGSWRVERTDYAHPRLLGFISYPTATQPAPPAVPPEPSLDGVPADEPGPEPAPEPQYVMGIDVSHHNGAIDFSPLKAAGFKYCFCKATEGLTFIDPRFEANWHGASENGLLRGAYHFARPTQDAKQQAEHFFRVVGPLAARDLPPVLDLEQVVSLPAASVVAWALTFLEHTKQLFEVAPIVYTSPGYWGSQLAQTPLLAEYLLWEAHYTSAKKPLAMAPWPSFAFWQFSDQGRVPGIPTAVDLNRFAGSEDDLLLLARAVEGVPEVPEVPDAGAGPNPGLTEVPEFTPLSLPDLDLTAPVVGRLATLLQGLLLAQGYGPQGLVDARGLPDGNAGPRTAEYLMHFRRRAGLAPEARVDRATWLQLLEP